MKSGRCPKCGSDKIHQGTRIWCKRGEHHSNAIPIGLFNYAVLDNYVCADCGYVESYVAERYDLERIAEKWPKAAVAGQMPPSSGVSR